MLWTRGDPLHLTSVVSSWVASSSKAELHLHQNISLHGTSKPSRLGQINREGGSLPVLEKMVFWESCLQGKVLGSVRADPRV